MHCNVGKFYGKLLSANAFRAFPSNQAISKFQRRLFPRCAAYSQTTQKNFNTYVWGNSLDGQLGTGETEGSAEYPTIIPALKGNVGSIIEKDIYLI